MVNFLCHLLINHWHVECMGCRLRLRKQAAYFFTNCLFSLKGLHVRTHVILDFSQALRANTDTCGDD